MSPLRATIRRVGALSWTGFVQLLRTRVYLNVLVAGVVLVGAALAFDRLSAGEGGRVLKDVGLAFIALVVAVLAGVTSITTLTREIETKQIHLIVARPVSRTEIVLGRFLTSAMLIVVSNAILGVVLAACLVLVDARDAWTVVPAALFQSWEGFVVAAIAVFFGVGSSSTMSALFTTTLFALGRLTPALRAVLDQGKVQGPAQPVLEAAYTVLPHLGAFDPTRWANGTAPVDVAGLARSAAYGALYAGAFLAFASFRLKRRDLL